MYGSTVRGTAALGKVTSNSSPTESSDRQTKCLPCTSCWASQDRGRSLTLKISAVMINSVCLPSAHLGFGLDVPSPNSILNFSFKPESLLVGLAMVGRAVVENCSVQKKNILFDSPQEKFSPPALEANLLDPRQQSALPTAPGVIQLHAGGTLPQINHEGIGLI